MPDVKVGVMFGVDFAGKIKREHRDEPEKRFNTVTGEETTVIYRSEYIAFPVSFLDIKEGEFIARRKIGKRFYELQGKLYNAESKVSLVFSEYQHFFGLNVYSEWGEVTFTFPQPKPEVEKLWAELFPDIPGSYLIYTIVED